MSAAATPQPLAGAPAEASRAAQTASVVPDPTTAPIQRTEGELRIAFRGRMAPTGARASETVLETLYQRGASRARLPRRTEDGWAEVITMNTAGGLTGGDRLRTSIEMAADTRAVVTTAASEKIYRSAEDEVSIANAVELADGASLDWIPQETILFDRARLRRALTVDMHDCARLLAVESVVFGRTAMDERVDEGSLSDRWRIRRGGVLAFADDLRVRGRVAEALARPATLAGGCALASLLLVAPDAEARLDPVREALREAGGASAWDGLLVVRVAAADGAGLRSVLLPVLSILRDGRPLPRVWSC